MLDADGDGKDDFVGYQNGNWYVARSNGTQFLWPEWGILGHGVGSNTRLLNDIDGDGRMDAIVYFANSGSWYAASGQPNATFGCCYGQWGSGHGVGSTDQLMGDIDGNGAEDAWCFWKLLGSCNGCTIIWNSYGLGNGGLHSNNDPRNCGNGANSTIRVAADFTGDGREDLGYVVYGSWYVLVSNGFSLIPSGKWLN